MTQPRPVVVIGAGPAGIAAAVSAAAIAPTILLDERATPGGRRRWQIDPEDELRHLHGAGVDYRPGVAAWALFPGPFVAAYDDARVFSLEAGAVVVATGAVDRRWPIPGWQMDGLLTASQLEAPIRGESSHPGARYGVLGHGDAATAAVAAVEAAGGQTAVAIEELDGARIEGDHRVERLCGPAGCVEVDRVVMAIGTRPDPALVLQARAASTFIREALVEVPLLAADGATSLPGVFVAGEAAGFASLDDVRSHGERAGASAAAVASGGEQSNELEVPSLEGVTRLPLPADPETIICRDQQVTLDTIRSAIAAGARDVNDIRRRTRAGMGPGGGGEVLAVLAAMLLETDPTIPGDYLIGRHRPPARPLPFRIVLDTPVEVHP